jgi:hypothetical protein
MQSCTSTEYLKLATAVELQALQGTSLRRFILLVDLQSPEAEAASMRHKCEWCNQQSDTAKLTSYRAQPPSAQDEKAPYKDAHALDVLVSPCNQLRTHRHASYNSVVHRTLSSVSCCEALKVHLQ